MPMLVLCACTPPSSAAAASPVGLPASPTPKYPRPTTVQQVLARSRCNMCSKQCLPGTCHHKQDIHRHRQAFEWNTVFWVFLEPGQETTSWLATLVKKTQICP